MDIYIYSDESGVFDKVHNDIYVYGGVVFLSKEDKDNFTRKYSAAEKRIFQSGSYKKGTELKACKVTNKEKNKLYRSANQVIKFGVVVNQARILDSIYQNKKSKQRYLDFAYKIGLKKMFQAMIHNGTIVPAEVENIYIVADEHTTATDGRYELREALEQEFRIGTHNFNKMKFHPPIFQNLKNVTLAFGNSNNVILVRTADIVANNIFYKAKNNINFTGNNLYMTFLP